ncbi:MAG: SRPBCC family protein [Actinomycetia bacterium]|nr:SRPBCC family protein [Actinomycetes bacterium]
MTEVTRSRQVVADPAMVWEVLGHFGAISQWAPNVDHSCLMSDQTEGVGTVRRVQTGRTTLVEQVTEWEPGSTLAYTIEGLPALVRSVVNRWTLDASNRGTLISLSSEIDTGPRPPQRLVARVVGRKLATESEKMLDGLDRHLSERGSAIQ